METPERHQPLVGRCLCGKYEVSLTASPEKRKVFACHCTDCKKWTGSMSFVGFLIRESAVTVSDGKPTVFEYKVDSGITIKRVSCETCGSSIWARTPRHGGFIEVAAGLFPPSSIPAPSAEVFMRSMAPWEAACPAAKRYETSPGA